MAQVCPRKGLSKVSANSIHKQKIFNNKNFFYYCSVRMSEYVPLSEYVPMSENVPLSKFFDAYKCCKGRRRRLLNASRLKKFAHFSYLTLTKCRTNELLWYLRRGWHIYLLSNENLILSFIDTNLWIPLHLCSWPPYMIYEEKDIHTVTQI